MEQLLKLANQRPNFFTDILNSINDAIYITDKNGVTLWVNHISEVITQVPREKLIGRNVRDLEKERVFSPSVTRLAAEANSNVSTVQEVRDGRKFIATGHLVKDEKGEVIAIVAHCRDITEAVKTSSKLRDTEELLEKYSQELRKLKIPLHTSDLPAKKELILHPSTEDLIGKIAKVNTTALITGETGTGKSATAERIHLLSKRYNAPFIQINCASMPEQLLESELFGYKKGAFTGAHTSGKQGLIQAAEGGTLFLDEIGELPTHLQAKLLHFLQTKTYLPIGAREYVQANVRIIAATNRNLEKMTEEGSFRSDLYYRLHILAINLPPLRERKEVIKDLAFYFLDTYNQKYNVKKRMTSGVLDIFQSYHWPGNIRELENLMERLVILCDQTIDEKDLPQKMMENLHLPDYRKQTDPYNSMPELLENIERNMILDALKKEKSTRKAAQKLGVTQSLLMRRVRKYGIDVHAESAKAK
ncbi:PAS domain S-box-containing protein [Cytobacillus oceanisediminis]|uniref:HTH-type transcriptional regulatory protein TyrR n=1 Tax=Cytobacillus oceanisediminis TaxID=665099 RepID=A0A2V3A8W8_9BACI|nr:sigma 54-interacting transcriptional regulator [Cytobacillus oceanisediminis]PWW31373.1 PAS domain S-box-containing protein [Cytobacillus oceanisediminis]